MSWRLRLCPSRKARRAYASAAAWSVKRLTSSASGDGASEKSLRHQLLPSMRARDAAAVAGSVTRGRPQAGCAHGNPCPDAHTSAVIANSEQQASHSLPLGPGPRRKNRQGDLPPSSSSPAQLHAARSPSDPFPSSFPGIGTSLSPFPCLRLHRATCCTSCRPQE